MARTPAAVRAAAVEFRTYNTNIVIRGSLLAGRRPLSGPISLRAEEGEVVGLA
jgi:hypothetical protein